MGSSNVHERGMRDREICERVCEEWPLVAFAPIARGEDEALVNER